MRSEVSNSQVFELNDFFDNEGVTFDPEEISLHGCYRDEISAHRAKKLWVETFESNFILENEFDFSISVMELAPGHGFLLSCEFLTACARYAFWRLTNNQAPEAQYIIETAHIPMCESRHEDILRAPDMRSIYDEPMIFSGKSGTLQFRRKRQSMLERVNHFFDRFF